MNILKSLNKKDRVMIFLSVLSITFVYITVSLLFRYCDARCFTIWGVQFWDALFSGELDNFYSFCGESIRGLDGDPHGSWLTFFPIILWNFPVWITHPISKNWDVSGMKCILWNKLFLYIWLVVLCIYVSKIILHFYEDRKKEALLCAILIASSFEIMQSVAYAGQDEIIYLAFMIMSMFYRLKGKEKTYLVCSLIAVTICPLMIIPIFLVELLYMQKKNFVEIMKVVIHLFIMILPSLLFALAYANNERYHLLSDFNTLGLYKNILNTGVIDTTFNQTSICATILVLLGIVCLMNSLKGKDLDKKMITMVALCMFALFFFPTAMWYRYCVFLPFFVLMAGISDYFNLNCILIIVIDICRFFMSFKGDDCIYHFSNFFSSSIATRLFNKPLDGRIIDSSEGWYNYLLYSAKPISLGLAIAVIYYASKKKKDEIFEVPAEISILMQTICLFAWGLYIIVFDLMI